MSDDHQRFDPQRKHLLLDPQREAQWDPPIFLSRLGIMPGQTVLDVGSGPGFWTIPLASLVGPQGTVWALDVSQELLDDLVVRNPPPQVRLRHTDLPQTGLPAAAADLAWLAFVFHEVMPPEQLADELRRVVKPGGKVAVLDWRPDGTGEVGAPRAHRVAGPGCQVAEGGRLRTGRPNLARRRQLSGRSPITIERCNMKIAIVSDDGESISQHFGRAEHYVVLTIEDGRITQRELREKFGHRHGAGDHHASGRGPAGTPAGALRIDCDPSSSQRFSPVAEDSHARMAASIPDCTVVLARWMGRAGLTTACSAPASSRWSSTRRPSTRRLRLSSPAAWSTTASAFIERAL